jgi:hypothetical protein
MSTSDFVLVVAPAALATAVVLGGLLWRGPKSKR